MNLGPTARISCTCATIDRVRIEIGCNVAFRTPGSISLTSVDRVEARRTISLSHISRRYTDMIQLYKYRDDSSLIVSNCARWPWRDPSGRRNTTRCQPSLRKTHGRSQAWTVRTRVERGCSSTVRGNVV